MGRSDWYCKECKGEIVGVKKFAVVIVSVKKCAGVIGGVKK